jgi:hypothetical protein
VLIAPRHIPGLARGDISSAQDPEEAPHLNEGGAADRLDSTDRFRESLGFAGKKLSRGTGHSANPLDPTNNQSVEVSRDTGALGGDRSAREALSLFMELGNTVLELGED